MTVKTSEELHEKLRRRKSQFTARANHPPRQQHEPRTLSLSEMLLLWVYSASAAELTSEEKRSICGVLWDCIAVEMERFWETVFHWYRTDERFRALVRHGTRKYAQTELAALVGVHRNTIANWAKRGELKSAGKGKVWASHRWVLQKKAQRFCRAAASIGKLTDPKEALVEVFFAFTRATDLDFLGATLAQKMADPRLGAAYWGMAPGQISLAGLVARFPDEELSELVASSPAGAEGIEERVSALSTARVRVLLAVLQARGEYAREGDGRLIKVEHVAELAGLSAAAIYYHFRREPMLRDLLVGGSRRRGVPDAKAYAMLELDGHKR